MRMAIATVNATFATEAQHDIAARGMLHLVEVKILPAMQLYRFANAADRATWYAAPWWLGKSAYEALLRSAQSNNESLSRVARRCLAVPKSPMDVLISVRILQPLTAWSGTPKTLRLKAEGGRYLARQEPDRAITQLYIPGLDPKNSSGACVAWNEVFTGTPRFLTSPRA
jgi:hypothetical protein